MIDPRTGADLRARHAFLAQKAGCERPWPRPLKGIFDGTLTLRRLYRVLRRMLDHLGLCEEYFSTASALDYEHVGRLDATWDELVHGTLHARWIACYAVTGTSEGHYVHVEVLAEGGRHALFLGKTFQGQQSACCAASLLAMLLGA